MLTLAAAGYDTRSFTANAWISDALGLTHGFAWTDEARRTGTVGRTFHPMYRLLDRLGFGAIDSGSLDRTILVVLADHGEMLGEHGEFGHGLSLYEPVLHVPLLVRYPPRITAARVSQPVSTVGVYATVLELGGITPPPPLQVGSLVSAIAGRAPSGPVLAEQFASLLGSSAAKNGTRDPLRRQDARFRAYRAGRRKLIEASVGTLRLFDLAADPTEARDLAPAEPDAVARLRGELETWRAALALAPARRPRRRRAGARDRSRGTRAPARPRLRAVNRSRHLPAMLQYYQTGIAPVVRPKYTCRMRVTRKGQVTVPKDLRDRLGITSDTEVEFREERGKLVLLKKNTRSAIAKLRGKIKRLPVGKDVDDYLRLTRGNR